MRVLLTFLVFVSCNLYSKDKPNIIIILTDDLGWGDVSYHGGYIPTPFEYKLQDIKTKNVNKTRMKSFKLFN